jgi:hypothetical protein
MTTLSPFTINGRFLTQSMTGVQRYALNVVNALDVALGKAGAQVSLAVPSAANGPSFDNILVRRTGFLSGHSAEWARTCTFMGPDARSNCSVVHRGDRGSWGKALCFGNWIPRPAQEPRNAGLALREIGRDGD